MASLPRFVAKDFTYPWRAARALVDGHNPYVVIQPTGPYPFESALPYPLPAVLAALPVQGLRAQTGATLFIAVSTGLAAWGLLREGAWRLWTFAGAPFAMSVILAQWGSLLLAGALLPAMGWALACKPTLGLALFVWRPNRWIFLGGALVCLASLVILPSWPLDWWRATRTVVAHPAPVTLPFGWVPLLALLAWRRPEARLVAVMACVPQNLYFYDQLPLALVAWNAGTAALLAALSWLAWILTKLVCADPHFCGDAAAPRVIALLYIPATVLVLWRDRQYLPIIGPLLARRAAAPMMATSAGRD